MRRLSKAVYSTRWTDLLRLLLYKKGRKKFCPLSVSTHFRMQLILTSGSSPWNTNYCNESGQVLYKASAPGWCLLGRNIKISRTISPTQYEKKVDSPFDSDDTKTLVDPSIYSHRPPRSLAEEDESGFECIGEVEYHVFKKSYIKYGGVDRPVNQFFKQVGFGFYGRWALMKDLGNKILTFETL